MISPPVEYDAACAAEFWIGSQAKDMTSRLYQFIGRDVGAWSVIDNEAIVGPPLPTVNAIDIVKGDEGADLNGAEWVLRGVTSNERYVTRSEKKTLVERQPSIGRPGSIHAALIPIRKSTEWWMLAQDERRQILEESSNHISVGLDYLPAIARRLHHCRDTGTPEPFDFVTYFEFNEADQKPFDELVSKLRASEEWKYVDREVDIRMIRRRA